MLYPTDAERENESDARECEESAARDRARDDCETCDGSGLVDEHVPDVGTVTTTCPDC